MFSTIPSISHISKPKRISPSQVEVAESCPLHFVLNSTLKEEQIALPSSSSSRYTGMVYHKLMEQARNGKAGNPPEQELLEQIWEETVREVEEQAHENGDGCWIPLSSTDYRFERTRLRAIRFASNLVVRKTDAVSYTHLTLPTIYSV